MVKRVAGFPRVSPKAAGLDPAPFKELRTALRREVHELQCMSGAAHIVVHKGRCVLACNDGWANRKSRQRWGLDTICKLHGCTKPLVSAAFLTLVDEGLVKLSDPVSKHLRFAQRLRTRKAKRQPTLRNLLTMTAGLGYEDSPAYGPVMEGVRKGSISDLAGLCDAIADVPLQAEPGSRYEYSFCTDVLGRVCEAVSGERLDAFVRRRLLRPLGMRDTHFTVPRRKHGRLAVLYDAQKAPRQRGPKACKRRAPFSLVPWAHPESAPGILSGGGGVLSYEDPGMHSTARDYAKFVQMLLDDGMAPNGHRILSKRTARALWSDGLASYARRDGRLPGWNDADGPGTRGGLWDYTGCSLLHTHLVFDELPRGTGPPRRAQSMWMGGGGGTYWVADKRRGLASISFTQAFGGRQGEEDGLGPRGNDASTFATAAADGGRAAAKAACAGR